MVSIQTINIVLLHYPAKTLIAILPEHRIVKIYLVLRTCNRSMKLFTTISFVITSSFYFSLYKKARAPGFRTFVSAVYCSTETFSVRKEGVQNLWSVCVAKANIFAEHIHLLHVREEVQNSLIILYKKKKNTRCYPGFCGKILNHSRCHRHKQYRHWNVQSLTVWQACRKISISFSGKSQQSLSMLRKQGSKCRRD